MSRTVCRRLLATGLLSGVVAVQAAPIEEVIVTATKRTASVQDVPIAVTALNEVQLERAGVKDLRDLPTLSASFNMNSTQTESQGSTLRLRGVGTTGNNTGLESAVGVFLDGVYLSRPGVALGDLLDVEQIEILRGPQGTLFGRNTSAGALSIKTKKPLLDETEVFANASYGNFDAYNLQAGVSVPVIDNVLGLRLSGAVRESDGQVRSVPTDAESVTRDRWLLRGQALWVPRDDMDVRVILDYSDADEQCCDAGIISETPLAAAGAFAAAGLPANGGVVVSGDDALEKRQTNGEQFENPFEQFGASVEWNWDLDVGTFTYIGSYRDFEASSVQFTDFNALDVIRVPGTNGFDTFDEIITTSHEFRLQGVNGRLDWLVGAYYSDEEIDSQGTLELGDDYGQYISATAWFGGILPLVGNTLNAVPLATGGTFGDVVASPNPAVAFAGGVDPTGSFGANLYEQDSRSWSVFTHNTFEVTERLDLVLGLRWNDEEKDGSYVQLAGQSPACLNTLANAGALPAAAAPVAALSAGFMCFPFAAVADVPGTPLPQTYDDTFEDEELTYVISGAYEFTDTITGYASFSHGFKAGGFNLDSTAAVNGADPRFDSETVDAWEIGLKSDLLDRTLRANLALFWMEMEDFQVLEFTGVQFTTFNVDKAESKGLELETLWSPIDGLDVNVAWTWADAEYPDDCAGAGAAQQVQLLCGFELTNAPEHVVVAGFNWEQPIEGTDLSYFVTSSVRWEDDRRTSTQAIDGTTGAPLAADIQDSNAKVNLRIGLGEYSGRWTVEAWANNLFDEQTQNVAFNIPLRGTNSIGTGARGVFFDAPRTYGLTLRTAL